MLEPLLLRVKRGETPFYARLRRIALAILRPEVPVPRWALRFIRPLYALHWGLWRAMRTILAACYNGPLFRARCEATGKHIHIWLLPHVQGHTRIYLGDNVTFNGKVGITSGRTHDAPTLRIGHNVQVGHLANFIVNREIVVEDNVLIAGRCTISDNDGHPRDPARRALGLPPAPEDVKPVRICRHAWLGEGAQIRKGVTIGEGAVVGASAVVLTDVPPNCIAIGNPAKIVGFAGQAKPSD